MEARAATSEEAGGAHTSVIADELGTSSSARGSLGGVANGGGGAHGPNSPFRS